MSFHFFSLFLSLEAVKDNNLLFLSIGSGKTLAYLIPIIDKLLKYEEEFGKNEEPNRPLGLVLVPSRELADQTEAVARDLGNIIGFRTLSQCGGRRTQKLLKWKYKVPMDIVVATPGVLSKILTNSRCYCKSKV